jgi:two-component system, LuxR family, sensor kinase FixL
MIEPGQTMIEGGQTMRSNAIALPRGFPFSKTILGLGYLAGFVFLDWISLIEPYGPFEITPWSPNTGLSFVLVLLAGQRMIPFLFVAPLVDTVARQLPLPWSVQVLSSVLIGAVYAAALLFLTRPKLRFNLALSSMRDLILLTVVAVVGAALVALGYVLLMIVAGLMPATDLAVATLRYWVGDVIGIMVVTPFALIALTRRQVPRMSIETALQIAAILAALALVFGYSEAQQFQLFYVLFLPIVWMAVRTGIEGVIIAIMITQLGLILGVQLFPNETRDFTAFQALMLVLAMTGLVAGELVTEHRRTEAELRLHQESLARLARLGSMGELAAAVAHELNQPLMAAGTYTRLVHDAMRSGTADAVSVAETAKKAVAQVERAAEVVRRLRALVRLDRSSRAACRVEQIVKETIDLCRPDLDRLQVTARTTVAADLPPVMVDMLQIEQALLNLLRNSMEAIGEAGRGSISIEATLAGDDFVEIRVRDSGPGFPPDLVANPFLPFASTKAEGLGIGLALCKSIIEAHGGRLWLSSDSPGGAVYFTLPIVKSSNHG